MGQLKPPKHRSAPPPSRSPVQSPRLPGRANQGTKSQSRRTTRASAGGSQQAGQAQLAEANGRKCNMLVILLAQQMFTRPRAISACCCCWSSTKFKLTHSAPATACEDLGMLPTAFVGSFWTMVCCASASCVNLATQPWSSPCNISTARSLRHDKGAAAARKLPGWRSKVVGGG